MLLPWSIICPVLQVEKKAQSWKFPMLLVKQWLSWLCRSPRSNRCVLIRFRRYARWLLQGNEEIPKILSDSILRLSKDHFAPFHKKQAHRRITVLQADRILVVDQGRIVEMGSPEDLLARRGLFFDLYQAQSFDLPQIAL